MKDGFNQVVDSDAVLVCNYTKNNIKGYYLGTSVLMELAVAYYHNKNIFFLTIMIKLKIMDWKFQSSIQQ